MSLFITNLLKLNARQLINKKSKRKKPLSNRSFLAPSSNASVYSASSSTRSNHYLNAHHQISSAPAYNLASMKTNTSSSLIITSPLSSAHHLKRQANNKELHIQNLSSPILNSHPFQHVEHISTSHLDDPKRPPAVDDSLLIGKKKVGRILHFDRDDVAVVKFDSSMSRRDFYWIFF